MMGRPRSKGLSWAASPAVLLAVLLLSSLLSRTGALFTSDGTCVCGSLCVLPGGGTGTDKKCNVLPGVAGCTATSPQPCSLPDPATELPIFTLSSGSSPLSVNRGDTVSLTIAPPPSTAPAFPYNLTVFEYDEAGSQLMSWSRGISFVPAKDTTTTAATWEVPADLPWPSSGASRTFVFGGVVDPDPAFSGGKYQWFSTTLKVTVTFPSAAQLGLDFLTPVEEAFVEEGAAFTTRLKKSSGATAWAAGMKVALVAKLIQAGSKPPVIVRLSPVDTSKRTTGVDLASTSLSAAFESTGVPLEYSFAPGSLAGDTALAGKRFMIYAEGVSSTLLNWKSAETRTVTVLPPGTPAVFFSEPLGLDLLPLNRLVTFKYGLLNAICDSDGTPTKLLLSVAEIDGTGALSNEVFLHPDPNGFRACTDVLPNSGSITVPLPSALSSSLQYAFRIKIAGSTSSHVIKPFTVTVPAASNEKPTLQLDTTGASFSTFQGGTSKTLAWTLTGLDSCDPLLTLVAAYVVVSHASGIDRIPIGLGAGACSGTASATLPVWTQKQLDGVAQLVLTLTACQAGCTSSGIASVASITLTADSSNTPATESTLTITQPSGPSTVATGESREFAFSFAAGDDSKLDCASDSPFATLVSAELRAALPDGNGGTVVVRRLLTPTPVAACSMSGSPPTTTLLATITPTIPVLTASTEDITGASIVIQVVSGRGLGTKASVSFTLTTSSTAAAQYVPPDKSGWPFVVSSLAFVGLDAATPAVPLQSSVALSWSSPFFDCSTTSDFRSLATLEVTTPKAGGAQGVDSFSLRTDVPACFNSGDGVSVSASYLENVVFAATNLAASSSASLVLTVTSGIGKGAKAVKPFDLTAANAGTLAVRFSEPAPGPSFSVPSSLINPVVTINAGTATTFTWRFTGDGFTCGDTASSTRVILSLRYSIPSFVPVVPATHGIIATQTVVSVPLTTYGNGRTKGILACDVATSTGSFTWGAQLSSIPNVLDAEIVVSKATGSGTNWAEGTPTARLWPVKTMGSSFALGTVSPAIPEALLLLEPLNGTNLNRNESFRVKWSVADGTKVDCATTAPGTVSLSARTGRSFLRIYSLSADATDLSSAVLLSADTSFEVCTSSSNVRSTNVTVPDTAALGPMKVAVAVVSGKGSDDTFSQSALGLSNLGGAGLINITLPPPPPIDNSGALAILDPAVGSNLFLNRSFELRWNVTDTMKLDCLSTAPTTVSLSSRSGRSYLQAYLAPSNTSVAASASDGFYFPAATLLSGDALSLACNSTSSVGSASFVVPYNFSSLGPAKLVIVAASGKGSDSNLERAAFAVINGTVNVTMPPPPPIDNSGALAILDPAVGSNLFLNRSFELRWNVTDTMKLDCLSTAPTTVSLSSRSGRSYLQAYLAPSNTSVAASASDGFYFPAATLLSGDALSLACNSTSSVGSASFVVPYNFSSLGPAKLVIVAASGKGSDSNLERAAFAVINGTVNVTMLPPAPVPPPITILQPADKASLIVNQSFTVKWSVADPAAFDCSTAEPATVSLTATTGRSYLRPYLFPLNGSLLGAPVALGASPLVVCNSSNPASASSRMANVTVPSNFTLGPAKLALVVVAGRGGGGGSSEALDQALTVFLNGTVNITTPSSSDSGSAVVDAGEGLFLLEPVDKAELRVNNSVLVKWRVTNASRFDCSTIAPETPDLNSRTGRSLVQAFLAPLGNLSTGMVTPLGGSLYSACNAFSPTGGGNFSVPPLFKWGNASFGIAVVVGKGSTSTPWDNAGRAALPGAVQVIPEVPSALEFVIPSPRSEVSPLFAASTNVTIRWKPTSLDCFAGSTTPSKVRLDLIIPRTPSVAHLFPPYVINLGQDLNACDAPSLNINGNGTLRIVMPADLPFGTNASLFMTVTSGWAKDLVSTRTPSYINLRGNRGVSIGFPGPNAAWRIPRRLPIYNGSSPALLSPASFIPPAQSISWFTGYLNCRFDPATQTNLAMFDMVSVTAYKEVDFFNTAMSAAALANASVWTYKDASNATRIPACTINSGTPFSSGGIGVLDLPSQVFRDDTRYVLVVSILSGPNAGLASAPVPFTINKPSIVQLRPGSPGLSLQAPAGSTYTLAWTASGLSSDELCNVTLRKSASVWLLATVKCMDNRATFLLSTVNAAGARVDLTVQTGYTFDVTLLTADDRGYPIASTLIKGSLASFEVTKGAEITSGSVKIRRQAVDDPSAAATVDSLTEVRVGSRVMISWALSVVPDKSPIIAKLCHDTQFLFPDPDMPGQLSKCGVVFDGSAPQSVTLITVPIFLNLTLLDAAAQYRVSLEVTLLASGTKLVADSPKFKALPPTVEDGKLRITSPASLPATAALSQPFNVSWATSGLLGTEMLLVELYRFTPTTGAITLVANLTAENNGTVLVPIRVDNLGGSCRPGYVCEGTFTVQGLASVFPALIAANKVKDTFKVCVGHSTVLTLRDCSVPITIFKEVQPMVSATLVLPNEDDDSAPFAPSGVPIVRLNDSLTVRYGSQGVSKLTIALMSSDRRALGAGFSNPVEVDAATAPTGLYNWMVPLAFPVPATPGVLFWFAVSSKDGPAVPVVAETSTFTIVPQAGVLSLKTPAGGAAFDLGKPLLVSWLALAVTNPLNISLLDASAEPMTEVLTLATMLPASQNSWTWPGSAINATTLKWADSTVSSGRYVIQLIYDDGSVNSTSLPFTLQKPAMRFDSITIAPQMVASMKLGDSVTVSWKALGLPTGTSGTLALLPSDLSSAVMATGSLPSSDRIRLVSKAVPLTSSTASFRFTLSGRFESTSKYLVYLSANGLSGLNILSETPGFSVVFPTDGFALLMNPPAASDGGAFIVGSQDSPITVSWVTTSGGVEQTDANAVTLALENRLVPGWSRVIFSSEIATVKTRSFPLPLDLDLSLGVASSYLLRATNVLTKANSTSGLFTASVPKAVITVRSPTTSTREIEFSQGDTIMVTFDVSRLPAAPDSPDGVPRVNVAIINPFVKGVVFEKKDVPASLTGTNSVEIASEDPDYTPPKGGEKSFFAVVRSAQFPTIAGSNGPFAVRSPVQSPQFTFTSIGLAGNPASSSGSPVTAVLKESDIPVLTWQASGFPLPTSRVNMTLLNARSPTMRRLVARSVPASAQSVTLTNTTLSGLAETSDTFKRGFFYYTVTSLETPSFSVNSSFFTVTPDNAVFIKVLSPSAPLSRVAGEELEVSWVSVGLSTSTGASVTVELLNDVLGSSLVLGDNLLPSGSLAAIKIPANTASSPFYTVRVRASSTVFAQSPLISIMQVSRTAITVVQPTAAVTAITGQPLDISWRALAADAFTLTITLANDLIDSEGPAAKVAEGISPSSGADANGVAKVTWIVPSNLRTSADLRTSYYLRFSLMDGSGRPHTESWTSPTFTIVTRDAFVSPLSPLAGDSFTIGGVMPISWAARNLKNGRYKISLLNEAVKTLLVLTENARTTNFAAATGASSGSFVWNIPSTLPVTPSASSSWFVIIAPVDLPSAAVRAGPLSIRPLTSAYLVLSPAKDAVVSNGSQVRVVFTLSSEAAAVEGAAKVNITLCNKMLSAEMLLASFVSPGTSASNVLIPSSVPLSAALRSSYFLRVSPAASGTGFSAAESDVFTIAPLSATGSIRILSPSVGAVFTRGDRINVAWSASETLRGGTVRVEIVNTRSLAKAILGFAGVGLASADDNNNDDGMLRGSGSFPVPATLPVPSANKEEASRFVVRVVSASDESVSDTSARFNLSSPSQLIRVFNTSVDPPRPSPMAGERVDVLWAALGLSEEAQVSIFLRNMTAGSVDSTAYSSTAANDDAAMLPAGTTSVGSRDNCVSWNFSAPATIETGGGSWICGMYSVPVDDVQASGGTNVTASTISWSVVVRSADDPSVGGFSRSFTVRARQMPLSITVTKPAAGSYALPVVNTTVPASSNASTTNAAALLLPVLSGYEYVVGDVLPVEWLFNGGTGSGRVELYCVSPFAGEVRLAVINPQVVLSSLKPTNSFRLTYAQFAVAGEERFERCFVQVRANSGPAAAARSAFFPIRLPQGGISLVDPKPLRSTFSSRSLFINPGFTFGNANFSKNLEQNPSYAGPITYLSGQGLGISWSFSTEEVPITSYTDLRVTLRRINAYEGTSEQVAVFYPTPEVLAFIEAGNTIDQLPTSLSAETNIIPGTLPLSLYWVEVSCTVAGLSKVPLVDRSEPFFIRPRSPFFTVTEPKRNAVVDAGGLLRIAYASQGVSATNRLIISIGTAETTPWRRNTTLISNSTEATGIFLWPIPPNFVRTQTRFTVRLGLNENSTARAESAVFFIRPRSRYITVDSPAPDPVTNALPLWKAEDQVWVNFSFVGFDYNPASKDAVTTAAIELWQDRFFVAGGGGDKLLAVLAPSVPLLPPPANNSAAIASTTRVGNFSFPVPSDIDSSALVYVLVRPSSDNSSLAQMSGRSKLFPIRSSPTPGLREFLDKLCGGLLTASDPSAAAALPAWMASMPALRAFCAKTCSDCTSAAFDGVWMSAVGVSLDFNMSWIGGQRELRMFKNLLGAFRAEGSNLCWPRTLLDKSSLSSAGPGSGSSSSYGLDIYVPWYERFVLQASNNKVGNTTARLIAADVAKPLTSCTGMQPMTKSAFSIKGLDPSALSSGAAMKEVVRRIRADVLAKLIASGISAVDGDISVNIDTSAVTASGASAGSTSTSSSGGSGSTNSLVRRLQAVSPSAGSSSSSAVSTSGSVTVSTAGDSDAQAASVVLSNPLPVTGNATVNTTAPVALPGLSISEGQTVTTQQQQSTGTAGGTSSAYSLSNTDGSATKALSADNNEDQLTSAFAPGGWFETLAIAAAKRDLGTPAVTPPPPTPTPRPGPTQESHNLIAILAGSSAAVFILIVVAIFAANSYRQNQKKKRWQGGLLSSDNDKGGSINKRMLAAAASTSKVRSNPVRRGGVLSSAGPTGGAASLLPGEAAENESTPMITNPLKSTARRQVAPQAGARARAGAGGAGAGAGGTGMSV